MISCVKIVVETQWHPTLVPVHLRNSLCDVIGKHPGVTFDTVFESCEEEGRTCVLSAALEGAEQRIIDYFDENWLSAKWAREFVLKAVSKRGHRTNLCGVFSVSFLSLLNLSLIHI